MNNEERETLKVISETFPELASDRRWVRITWWIIWGGIIAGVPISMAEWIWPDNRPLWRLGKLWGPFAASTIVMYLFTQVVLLQHLVWNIVKLHAEDIAKLHAEKVEKRAVH